MVTTSGRVVVANDDQNQDLLWAIRGGGPGLYGVVVEYVMRTVPLPENVVIGSLTTSTLEKEGHEASWDGLTALMRALPDLMDAGITGFVMATVSQPEGSNRRQVDMTMTFYEYNSTANRWLGLLRPLQERMASFSNNQSIQVKLSDPEVLHDFLDLFDVLNPVPSRCGDIALPSSRLLGRRKLTEMSHDTVKSYLKRVTVSQLKGMSTLMVIGLQGGPGPRSVENNMRGALTPAWRDAYLHVLVTGSDIDTTDGINPQFALQKAADWTNAYQENV